MVTERVKKILIFGADGYIGSHLKSRMGNFEVYSAVLEKNYRRKYYSVDITRSKEVLRILREVSPDIVVHTAAVSSLSVCEKDPDMAFRNNVLGTRNIIDAIIDSSILTNPFFITKPLLC